ncbi:MAG: hypothetical protein KGQ59_06420 [Bdellovibrionales bacterium]|nr:hypothetical protein [Bdellovibrionales bacterium]
MSDTPQVEFIDPQGQCFPSDFCEPQLNILAHAQSIEFNLGSRCGGHGICGGDKIQSTLEPLQRAQLLSRVTDRELEHLTPAEIESGWRLACQCFPEAGVKNLRFKTK